MKLTIKKLQTKEGTYKKGKREGELWKRYSVTGDFNTWYSTFDSDWGPNKHILEKWTEGMVIDVQVRQDPKGYWNILPPGKEGGMAPVPEKLDFQKDILEELVTVSSRQEEIASFVKQMVSEFIKMNERAPQRPQDGPELPEPDEANPPPHTDEDMRLPGEDG